MPAVTLSLGDARTGGFISSFLTALGFEVVSASDGDEFPRESALWILDAGTARLEAARRFLRLGKDRRLVVVGPAPEEWRAIGAVLLPDPTDLESLRMAIRES